MFLSRFRVVTVENQLILINFKKQNSRGFQPHPGSPDQIRTPHLQTAGVNNREISLPDGKFTFMRVVFVSADENNGGIIIQQFPSFF